MVLGALLLVYLAYTRLGGAERIDLTAGERLGGPLAIEGLGDDGDPSGSGASSGTIRQTEFIHRNEHGVVDRRFGFDTLLRREGDQWEITKPYYTLSMAHFRCDITADRGQVHCETALGGTPIPDDARFAGNVVIHVVPNEPNDPQELFVYLDDVTFIAERSLFSTTGPIKFVSRFAQLVGRGMELVYDAGRNRVELFRLQELVSLRGRSADLKRLTEETRPGPSHAADANEPVGPGEPNEVVLTAGDAPAEEPSDYYECVLWENVRIETPQQIVVARQRLAINNILWSDRDDAGPAQARPGPVSTAATVAGPNEPNRPEIVPYPGPNALDTAPSEFLALDTLPESAFDVVVTCDGGLVVGPRGIAAGMSAPSAADEAGGRDPNAAAAGAGQALAAAGTDPNHQTLYAASIDVNAVTSDAALAGPVQIGFTLDANDLAGRDGAGGPIPVTVTARDAVRYRAATNQIGLEGDCRVTAHQTVVAPDAPPARHEYVLTAPALLLDLMEDPNANGQFKLRHVTAAGGPVSLHGVRRVGEDVLGWAKLDGLRLDFGADANDANDLVVTGPGTISIYNAEAAAPGDDMSPTELSLRRPCYALMSNFKRLTYSASALRIVAASDERIGLDYLPIRADGSYGPPTNADAGHIEILLAQTLGPDGRRHTELATLTASRGITYEDETQRFAGATLVYDHATARVHVTGDDDQPCYFNGFLVDQIEMDLATRHVKTDIQAPGTLPIK